MDGGWGPMGGGRRGLGWGRGARRGGGRRGMGGMGRRGGRFGGAPAEPWMQQLVGTQHALEDTVQATQTARALGTGDVDVLATPVVLALAERAAVAALSGKVPSGQTTVGATVQVQHVAPTPVGSRVRAEVRIEGVDGRRLLFGFRVSDQGGEIARGRHVRAVVDRAGFEQSATSRRTP